MELEFEHRIKISDTDILSGVHFQNNEAQFYNIENARLYGQTSFTNNGEWYYWDEITQSLYDPNFNKDGLLLKNKDIELINMSHIPRSGVYAVCKENPLNNKHVFMVYIGSYGHHDLLWESPETDMGLPNVTKRLRSIYLTIHGEGYMMLECIFDGVKKQKMIEVPEKETVMRVRFRHKGRVMKIRILNIIGSNVILKNPVLKLDMNLD